MMFMEEPIGAAHIKYTEGRRFSDALYTDTSTDADGNIYKGRERFHEQVLLAYAWRVLGACLAHALGNALGLIQRGG